MKVNLNSLKGKAIVVGQLLSSIIIGIFVYLASFIPLEAKLLYTASVTAMELVLNITQKVNIVQERALADIEAIAICDDKNKAIIQITGSVRCQTNELKKLELGDVYYDEGTKQEGEDSNTHEEEQANTKVTLSKEEVGDSINSFPM